MRRYAWSLPLLLIVAALAAGWPTTAAERPTGEGAQATSWAQPHIDALTEDGLLHGYPQEALQPTGLVIRAELAKLVTLGLQLPLRGSGDFTDLRGHWSAPYAEALLHAGLTAPDSAGRFNPALPVTRAELTRVVVGATRLRIPVEAVDDGEPAFSDIDPAHPAYADIETAVHLGIVPPYVTNRFGPDDAATRDEAIAMVDLARRLQAAYGTVQRVAAHRLDIRLEDGSEANLSLGVDALIVSGGATAGPDDLSPGENVLVIADGTGAVRFVQTNPDVAPPPVAAIGSEVADRLVAFVQRTLSPDDIRHLAAGDWEALAQSARVKLYERLLEQGATPFEADAILRQDWASLQTAGRERLANALVTATGLSRDLAVAVLSGDWETAGELAQVEAVEYLLNKLLMENGDNQAGVASKPERPSPRTSRPMTGVGMDPGEL